MADKKEIVVETEKPSNFNSKNYFRSIKRFKWWVVGSTVLGAVVGFVGFKFVLNPSRSRLQATYTLELAGDMEDNGVYRFIDGSTFNYTDIASKKVLEEVKKTKTDYEGIDVEKIYSQNLITVERVEEMKMKEQMETYEISFKATIKSRAFSNNVVGKAFLNDLVSYPQKISSKAIDNYTITSHIKDGIENMEFDRQITSLKTQYKAIVESYEELQKDFTPKTTTGQNGETISTAYHGFLNEHSNGSLSAVDLLEGKLYSSCFVNCDVSDETSKNNKIAEVRRTAESYAENIESYNKQYAMYENSLEKMVSVQSLTLEETEFTQYLVDLNEKMNACKETINRLEKQLKFYGYKLIDGKYVDKSEDELHDSVLYHLNHPTSEWTNANTAFKQELVDLAATLKTDRTKAIKDYKSTYTLHRNTVTLLDTGYISVEKSIPNIVGLIAGAVLGFGICTLITTQVYATKAKKED